MNTGALNPSVKNREWYIEVLAFDRCSACASEMKCEIEALASEMKCDKSFLAKFNVS